MLVACTVLSLGCGSDEDGELPEGVDCDQNAPTYDDVAAFDKCAMCHDSALASADRRAAPSNINFDTYAGAEPHATKAAEQVNLGVMPPRNSGITLTDSEKQTLYDWAMCGALE